MTFNEWFEEYQPIKKNDDDSGPIIFTIKGLSLSDRCGSVPAVDSLQPLAVASKLPPTMIAGELFEGADDGFVGDLAIDD